ncbi:MAG TPA: diguanylate cyclase [Candidatus Sulfotelmatobacter sp.]|nr:diguanylate cyclase [Candidatus Sulfotelmatobacter sp.]
MFHQGFDYRLAGMSILIAIFTSYIALDLAGRVALYDGRVRVFCLAGAATSMGLGIWSLHYIGTLVTSVSVIPPNHYPTAITGVSLAAIFSATAALWLRRMLKAQKEEAGASRDGEARFRLVAEAIPQIVWTATPSGDIDYSNGRFFEFTGLPQRPDLRAAWREMIHPDDVVVAIDNWEQARQTGEPFNMEYRIRTAAGVYRWFLARATPMRDSGGNIVRWFGACTDIEDQMNTQQILEDQVRERAEELADANRRLQEEMWEKDLARRQLDEGNDRMVRELTERSQRATMLAKMGELLQSCVSNEEVFAAASGFGPKIFPAGRGAIALLNSARSLAEVSGSWLDCRLPLTVFEPNSCWALRTGHPHLVVHGDETARCAHAEGVENTYLCIPILAQGEALGILHFQTTDESPTLADAELSLKTTFAAQVGLSIANIRLREALRTQSIKDPLTGLYNRRYLTEMLEREIRRAVRAAQSLGVLILDLDHFKKFNDTYGHEAGDTVLRETASFLGKSIRVEDIACRFGGEEFVIILPTADLNSARVRAEKIRSKIRELAVLHQGQSLGMITVSIGVAALPEHGTDPKALLEAADAALYRAKREGRDRVAVAEPAAQSEGVVVPMQSKPAGSEMHVY